MYPGTNLPPRLVDRGSEFSWPTLKVASQEEEDSADDGVDTDEEDTISGESKYITCLVSIVSPQLDMAVTGTMLPLVLYYLPISVN